MSVTADAASGMDRQRLFGVGAGSPGWVDFIRAEGAVGVEGSIRRLPPVATQPSRSVPVHQLARPEGWGRPEHVAWRRLKRPGKASHPRVC